MSDYLFEERYRIETTLGEGGMGVVHLAHDMILDQMVAIKLLHADSLSEDSIVRFQREARASSKLKHPNLAIIYDFGVSRDGEPYMVSQHIEGRTIKQVVRDEGRLNLESAVPILKQIAQCLAYVHSKNVVHRDLKSSNVILREQDEHSYPVLVDFGIAKASDSETSPGDTVTRPGQLLGSPLYMSPEQARGESADHRSDIYSFGCVSYEMLTGSPPFRGDSALETLEMHMQGEPLELPPELEIPQELERVLRTCLEKSVEKRFQTASELAAMLDEIEHLYDIDQDYLDANTAPPAAKPLRIGLDSVIDSTKKTSVRITITVLALTCIAAGAVSLYFKKKDVEEFNPVEEKLTRFGEGNRFFVEGFSDKALKMVVRSKGRRIPSVSVRGLEPDWKALDNFGRPFILEFELFEPTVNDLMRVASNKLIVEFRLNKCRVSDQGLGALSKSRSIEKLSLKDTLGITKRGLQSLTEIPGLLKLDLTGTELTNSSTSPIARIKTLVDLELKRNPDVGDESIISLCEALRGLRRLHLANTGLTDRAMPAIGRLKVLERLYIENTRVTDNGLAYLKSDTIRAVDLSGTDATIDGILSLQRLKGLKRLTIPHAISDKKAGELKSAFKGRVEVQQTSRKKKDWSFINF